MFLTRDAQRAAEHDLAEAFRRRALIIGATVGIILVLGLAVLFVDSPSLFSELTRPPTIGLVALLFAAGATSLILLWRRAYVVVRLTASLARVGMLWG